LKSAIEGVVIKWATQINDVLTEESSQAFTGGQHPTPNAGMSLKIVFVIFCANVTTKDGKHPLTKSI
jgi:hypothetical protein